jgi:hypothetical protein
MNSAEAIVEQNRSTGSATRKIVHIDMDAFYASVEQRDNLSCAGSQLWWRGLADGLSSVLLPMKRDDLGSVPRCQR